MIVFQNRYSPYKLILMGSDVALTCLALAMVSHLRPLLPGKMIGPASALLPLYIYFVVALLWHVTLALFGVYQIRQLRHFSKQMPPFTAAYALAACAFAGLLFFTARETSRMIVISFYIADYVLLVSVRWVMSRYLEFRWASIPQVPTIIVGTSATAMELARDISDGNHISGRLVGIADTQPPTDSDLPAPFLGTTDKLPGFIQEHAVGQVFIALPEDRWAETESLIYMLESMPVRVYLIPNTMKLAVLNAEIEKIGQIVVIGLREPIIQGHRRIAKRALDLVLAFVALLLLWPLFVVIWAAIKLDSRGPAFYVPERVGQNGQIFRMIKFRTMVVDAEKSQSQVTTVDDQGRRIYKVKEDPRVTRVGRWLRRTSLDELPQLLNVIKGEMSIVGPRPEQPFITKDYDHWQWQRYLVPPGLTGSWQVAGRSDLPMNHNTQYDIQYITNYSLLLDLKIIVKTVGTVLRGKGAY
jgi:exopolysaccharide biosynthesis polyprenyl glycosylphosphotransferase